MSGLREAVVDLDAIIANVRRMREIAGGRRIIAVVKADGYGHGAERVARAALDGGADMLGTADVDEALALRAAGIDAPILSWLHSPDQDFAPALAAGITIGVSSGDELRRVATAADGGAAAIHLKFDTGLSRNGVERSEWGPVIDATRVLVEAGRVTLDGIFTHLSNTSDQDDRDAIGVFEEAIALVTAGGLAPRMIHAAATAAAIAVPESRFDTIRLGIGMYGFSPVPGVTGVELGLVPAMRLVSRVTSIKRVEPGTGVSYGYRYRTGEDSTLALIPIGYADGVPRQASSLGEVAIRGRRHRVAGRIAMDQFVVDVGDAPVQVGDEAVLFGDPDTGVPSATEWAEHAGTIDYEIVTRIGRRVPRRYTGGS